jgi:ankyrin repeat protein
MPRRSGDLDRLKILAAEDTELIGSYSPDGFTPLGLAAFFGRKDVLDFLLAHGANPNAASKNQMRVMPLHSAVAHRQPEIATAMVESLLSNGAKVNVAQDGGWTPLHQAAAHGQIEIIKLLLDQKCECKAMTVLLRFEWRMTRAFQKRRRCCSSTERHNKRLEKHCGFQIICIRTVN